MGTSFIKLERNLSKVLEDCSINDLVLGQPEIMAKTCQSVRAIFNNKANAHPPQDRIRNAVSTFIQTSVYSDEHYARLLAWGLTVPCVQSQSLIELDHGAIFLGSLEDRLLSVRIWRGLLASYFSYSGSYSENPVGRANWITLRSLLEKTFQQIFTQRPWKPEWMTTLSDNLNLLQDNPCARYVVADAEVKDKTVHRLKESLIIPETSWFMAELIRTTVEHACSYGDEFFKREIPKLCQLLRDHELYSNQGIILILNRYSNSSDTSECLDLERLAVDSWGNPKLPLSYGWNQIDVRVKEMVLKWLISKDLRIFFDLFSKDHDADQDKRRLRFWMRYVDQIVDAYFVLGSHAANSLDQDYVEMRQSNMGRISRLDQGGSPKNNAFIMVIGQFAIVEFGRPGNACFCFDLNNLPFRLESAWLRGDTSQLKNAEHSGCNFRLIHKDGPISWENAFEEELAKLGISPSSVGIRDTRRIFRTSPRSRTFERHAPAVSSPQKRETFRMDELKDFIERRFGLRIYDLRGRGGNLWIKPDTELIAVSRQLEKWGFKRKAGKGWWLS